MKRTLLFIHCLFLLIFYADARIWNHPGFENTQSNTHISLKIGTSEVQLSSIQPLAKKNTYIFDSIYLYEITKNGAEVLNAKGYSYFDTNGREIYSVSSTLRNGKWILSAKDTSTYDSDGNILFYHSWVYDYASNTWMDSKEEVCEYDDKGRLVLKLTYGYNMTTWEKVPTSKIEYTYNEQNQMVESFAYDFDRDRTNEFFIYYKHIYRDFVDGNKPLHIDGYRHKDVAQGWDSTYYELRTFDTLVYDAQFNLMEKRRWAKDALRADSLLPAQKWEWEFNAANQEILYTDYLTYSKDYSWAPWGRTAKTYDEYGCINSVLASFAGGSAKWTPKNRYQYFWSELNKEPQSFDVGVIAIKTPVDAAEWTNAETISVDVKNFGTSDVSDIPLVCMLNQISISGTITNTILAGQTLSYTFENKADMTKLKTYNLVAYTKLASDTYRRNDTCRKTVQKLIGLEDPGKTKLSVYPNPASDQLYIESAYPISDIEIYTFGGQKVQSIKTSQTSVLLPLTTLTQGVYILRIFGSRFVETRKIQVIR